MRVPRELLNRAPGTAPSMGAGEGSDDLVVPVVLIGGRWGLRAPRPRGRADHWRQIARGLMAVSLFLLVVAAVTEVTWP